MPDAQIHPTGTVPTPADYVVPDAAELLLKGVYAKYDGSGAAGPYLPLVRIVSDAGSTVIEAVSDTTVAAGASADASWFPHLAAQPSSAPAQILQWYYYFNTATVPAAGVFPGVADVLFDTATESLGSPIFDESAFPTVTPTVLETGVYNFTLIAQYATGQADRPGEYGIASMQIGGASTDYSIANTFELRETVGPAFRGITTLTGVWVATAGQIIEGNVESTHAGGTVNIDYSLLVQRIT